MQLHYISSQGKEESVNGAAELAEAIKSGRITAQTLVRTDAESKWTPAGVHAECLAFSGTAALATIEDTDKVKRLRLIGSLAWIAGPAILIVGGALTNVSAYKIGQITGGLLIWTLVIWGIVSLVRRRKPKPSQLDQARGRARVGVLVAVLCCGYLAAAAFEAQDERSEAQRVSQVMEQHLTDVEQTLSERNVTATQSTTSETPTLSPEPRKPAGRTDSSKMLVLVEDMIARQKLMQDKYQGVADASGIENILTPESLTSVEGRRRAREALVRVNAALSVYKQDLESYYRDLPTMPEKYGLSATGAEEFRVGAAASISASKPKTARVLELEQALLDLMNETVAFVDARPTPAEVDGEQIAFVHDYEIDEYNRLVEEMTAKYAEQTKLQTALVNSMREKMKSFAALYE